MENIYKKLLELQQKEIKVPKSGFNPFTKSKYATLDDINRIYKPLLSKMNLVVIHYIDGSQLRTEIVNNDIEEGSHIEYIRSCLTIPEGIKAQEMGSWITYAKRYNQAALLNIETQDDDDGNIASGKVKSADKKTKITNHMKAVSKWCKDNGAEDKPQSERLLSDKLGRKVDLDDYSEKDAEEDLFVLLG